ncbi:prolipoprotein diacylglyceryl transferase [Corynebacterium sp. 13CS0277]|uniref:prolipoprotein diacylglyceryl transferase n=1 Tax=Corynebacterium sp. 13CS0277 TaxID=2071994 RepID=UPI000D0315DB|nr:prolipoprotein diacylglyceryl transferase [Corynebacterium sp. 13CS0277]PRQ12519.1 prolipoprotein diacylglyceryl transferase [Corynebacterium sp. 13CS0277]
MTLHHLALIPSPPQGVWYLGPIPIRAYALCIITGIIVALWMSKRRYVARGGSADIVDEAAIVVVICGLIGGRLYHVATSYQQYFCADCNPWDAFKITNGGLGIMGAVALGVLGVWLLMRRRGLPLGPLADAIAPGLVLAQGIGRLGNYFNQELYGGPTDLPWGLEIYRRVDAQGNLAQLTGRSDGTVIAVVHPTFLYELIWTVIVCGILLWMDKRFRMGHGSVFVSYIVLYSLGRSVVEFMRTDTANHIFGLRINNVLYGILLLVALIILVCMRRTRETPEEVRGGQPAPSGADAPTAAANTAGTAGALQVADAADAPRAQDTHPAP